MMRAELRAAGIELDGAACARLAEFVAGLLAENERINLTAARSAAQVWREHVCDSLAVLPWLRAAGAVRLLDLGSGGGLPGLVLACVCPAAEVTVLDATRKKVDALGRLIGRVGLARVQAVWGRAEALAHEAAYREAYDVVTARAVAPLPALIEYAAGFVRPGGEGWFYKSAGAAAQERGRAASAAAACRLAAAGELRYRLPGEDAERVVLRYRKTGVLPAELPRRPGRAKKRPL